MNRLVNLEISTSARGISEPKNSALGENTLRKRFEPYPAVIPPAKEPKEKSENSRNSVFTHAKKLQRNMSAKVISNYEPLISSSSRRIDQQSIDDIDPNIYTF